MRSTEKLLSIMNRLRGPDGCPWDREQTLASLQAFLLEEAHEVLDAMQRGEGDLLREELGDLLFQIVFQSRIASELGWFDFEQVGEAICDKLIRRHPHVFGSSKLASSEQVIRQWEELKDAERRQSAARSRLAGVPSGLPALRRALRLSEKAARVGFDWPAVQDVFAKVREEIAEWEEAVGKQDSASAQGELGDLLFSLVNVARKLGLDPEDALQSTNDEFRRRFERMEKEMGVAGKEAEELSPEAWEDLWQRAKSSAEKG